MSISLQDAVRLVGSEKLKERTAGFEEYRNIFKSKANGEKLSANEEQGKEGARWIRVMEPLFLCVANDKQACLKKPTAVMNKRVKESANMVRWVVEGHAEIWSPKVVLFTLNHLALMLNHQGRLFEPVALDYLKALRAILSCDAHVEHFDQERWCMAAALCFNIILHDNLKQAFDIPDDGDHLIDESIGAPDDDGDATMTSGGGGSSNARFLARPEDVEEMLSLEKLMSVSVAPLVTVDRLGVRALCKYARFLDLYRTDSSAHLPALTGMNYVLAALEHNEQNVVHRFAQRSWNNLLNLWPTKNRGLKEQLIIAMRILLPFISQSKPRSSLPNAVSAALLAEEAVQSYSMVNLLQSKMISESANRWGIQPPTAHNFDFVIDAANVRGVFDYAPLRPGRVFGAQPALAWAALELSADATFRLSKIPPPSSQTETEVTALDVLPDPSATSTRGDTPLRTGSSRSTVMARTNSTSPTKPSGTVPSATQRATKRRKLRGDDAVSSCDPVNDLLLGLNSPSGQLTDTAVAARTWRLQTLLFIVLRHWHSLLYETREKMTQALFESLSNDDGDVQFWNMITLAAAAYQTSVQNRLASNGRSVALVSAVWAQVWPVACKRITLPSTSRASAHLAFAILQANLVPRAAALAEVHSLLSDFDLQGPPFPFDSVCAFLSAALELAGTDPALAGKKLEERVANWLLTGWSPLEGTTRGFKSRTKLEEHDPTDVVRLLAALCRLPRVPTLKRAKALLSSCPIVEHVEREREGSAIRAFLLNCEIDSGAPSAGTSVETRDETDLSTTFELDGSIDKRGLETFEQRWVKFLERSLLAFEEEWKEPAEGSGLVNLSVASTQEQARRTVDMAVLVLLFDATLSLNYVSTAVNSATSLVGIASRLLTLMADVAAQLRWSIADRAGVLKGFEPLLPAHDQSVSPVAEQVSVSLVSPGQLSDVRREVLFQQQHRLGSSSDLTQDLSLFALVWHRVETSESILEHLRKAFELVTGGKVIMAEEARAARSTNPDDALWDNIRSNEVDQSSESSDNNAIQAVVELCIGALADVPQFRQQHRSNTPSFRELSETATTDKQLSASLVDGPIARIETALSTVARAFADGRLHLSQRTLNSILGILGDSILPAYSFSHSEHAQLLSLDFVEATMRAWMDPSAQGSDLVDRSERCAAYFAKQLQNTRKKNATKGPMQTQWRVRVRLAALLERILIRSTDAEGAIAWKAKRPPLKVESIVTVLVQLTEDEDMRVRFAAATAVGRVFDIVAPKRMPSADVWTQVEDTMPIQIRDTQHMQSRVLVLGNVLVACAAWRHEVLHHIVCLAACSGDAHEAILAVLSAVAQRLGFAHLRDLWLHFAGHVLWELARSDQDIDLLKLPYHVFGYKTRKENIEHTFRPVASMLLADAQPNGLEMFESLVGIMRKSNFEAKRECFHFVVAIQLTFAGGDIIEKKYVPSDEQYANLWGSICEVLADRWECEEPQEIEDMVQNVADQIVIALLHNAYEASVEQDAGAALLESLQEVDSATAEVLRALFTAPRGGLERVPYQPAAIVCSAMQVFHGLRILDQSCIDITSQGAAYHVIQQMLSHIHAERLVNDQARMMYALKIYVALSREGITSSTVLLGALLHGCTALLGLVDLFDMAVGVLEWSLRAAVAIAEDGTATVPGLSGIFVGIVEQAERYMLHEDVRARQAGQYLYEWLDVLVPELLETSAEDQIRCALYAWPRDYSPSFADRVREPTLGDLTLTIKQLTPISSLNTRTLMRLCEALARSNEEDKSKFVSGTIWRLLGSQKNASGSSGASAAAIRNVNAARAEAIAQILSTCEGHLHTPRTDTLEDSGADREQMYDLVPEAGASDEDPTGSLNTSLFLVVLRALRTSRALERRPIVLSSLRAILTIQPDFAMLRAKWPDHTRQELDYISTFPTCAIVPPRRSLSELDRTEATLQAESFEGWISYVSALLCDNLASINHASIYGQISPLVDDDADLAERLFAMLLHAALFSDWLNVENQQINRKRLSNYFARILKHEKASRRAWSAIVDAVLHLRRFWFDDSPLGPDCWLEVDFLLLAQRARDCRLYASALLFVELAKEHAPDGKFDSSEKRVSELLYSIYSNTEDPDSFYAIKNPDLRASLIRRLHHEGQWSRAFEMHAADYESLPAARTPAGAAQASITLDVNLSLHEMGFNRLALMLGQAQQMGDRADISYDVAWRSANWDLPTSSGGAPGTSRGLFAALRAVHRERDPNVVTGSVASALEGELSGLCEVGIEANTLARRVSRDLLSLHQVSEWCNQLKNLGDSHAAVQHFERSWSTLSDVFEFADFERILAVRQSLLRSARQRSQANEIGAGLVEDVSIHAARLERQLLLRLSQGAREQGKLQTAMGAVTLAQHLDHEQLQPDGWQPGGQGSRYLSNAVSEEFANVLWAQGEHVIAIQALDEVIKRSKVANSNETAWHAMTLAQLGQWRATARSDQPRVIMETYFQPAWQTVVKQQASVEEQAKVAHDYAVFADQQYRSIASSDDMRKLEAFVRDRNEEITLADRELAHLRPKKKANMLDPIQQERYKSLYHQRTSAAKILGFDQTQLLQHRTSQRLFRSHAVAMYAAALTAVDKYDDDITRLTSLWFEHADNEEFNLHHHDDLLGIPSRKFLSLTHQISSRLIKSSPSARNTPAPSSSSTPSYEAFNTNVRAVMTSMCRDHPFHALYSIYALRKGASDEVRSVGGSQSRGASQVAYSPQQLRGAAAEEIMATLKTNEVLRQRIIDWERVCSASVEWAEYQLHRGDVAKTERKLPNKDLLIGRLKAVPVPVFTRPLPIDPSCRYTSFVSIARFGSTYKTAGGVHVPKIIDCIGSDGKYYPQLYKADDDLRQDAVMQQVFGLVNELLAQDRAARKRQLKVRTYAVIPLGPQCGLMEFVSNTSPLCDPIVESHARFGTGDISPAEAREKMSEQRSRSDESKVETWRKLAARMPPTFHAHFMEQHKLPLAWLGTRLNYTRSVAVTSIVGHMLGIGDRHVSNILLDNRTGEVVHIDFGVAFEQGKLLPMPELIPFRLTRDVVDGMGLSGTEGVFRRSCEETLRVLREGADVIKTVLEVFKYDPLWAWASSPIKVLKAQAAGEDDVDALNARMGNENPGTGGGRGTAELQAERAINSVMTKLSTSLSVEYTVNDLIQQATDPANLGLLFAGWQSLL